MSIIDFQGVTKTYNGTDKVLDNIDLTIEKGEFVVLIGESGCGKTTLLKLINGLIIQDYGDLEIQGRLLKDWDIIELRRNIGYVIQQIGLFPHMSIEDNIGYVLNLQGEEKAIIKKKSEELIELVGLEISDLSKYPSEMSGGQKQRVGVARALAANPEVILMDEPFGAVDEITRKVLQEEIVRIHKNLNKTIVFVTHDIEEAFKVGTRIILLNNGRIEQDGNRYEMIFEPKTDYVKNFFGNKNFSSYLNLTRIETVYDKKEAHEKENYPEICSEAFIIEGIKLLYEKQVDKLNVLKDNVYIGEFSMGKIR